ncbi:MAG: response regulator [Bacteroidota bacterium]|nr:response regulator [Bacteroidota bacterium]
MSKLLIVDDSIALLEVMKSILEKNGYIVKTLENALDIYKQIIDFKPDLLLIDINLSSEDGRNICRQVRMTAQTKNLCILAFSGFPETLKDYKTFCADDVLEKPFDLNTMVNKIKFILNECKTLVR